MRSELQRQARVATVALLLGGLAVVLAAGLAKGERGQKGDLRASFNAEVFPRKLPRYRPAPVGLRIDGRIQTLADEPLPQVKQIRLNLAGRGVLSVRGLKKCPLARLRYATSRTALRRCGAALIGSGGLDAAIYAPRQRPLRFHGQLLAFNGRTRGGSPAMWVHVYSPDPPISFVLPFAVVREPGRAHTTIVARLPRALGSIPRLEGFRLTVFRRFRYRGEWRSYLSASCPAPQRWKAGFLVTRGIYSFAHGSKIEVQSVRSCRPQVDVQTGS